jgi:hypothetical protein
VEETRPPEWKPGQTPAQNFEKAVKRAWGRSSARPGTWTGRAGGDRRIARNQIRPNFLVAGGQRNPENNRAVREVGSGPGSSTRRALSMGIPITLQRHLTEQQNLHPARRASSPRCSGSSSSPSR